MLDPLGGILCLICGFAKDLIDRHTPAEERPKPAPTRTELHKDQERGRRWRYDLTQEKAGDEKACQKAEYNEGLFAERQKLLRTITSLNIKVSTALELLEPIKTMSEEEREEFAKSVRIKLEQGELNLTDE